MATNDSYAKGAMVLGQSLRNHNTSKKLVVMIGPHVSDPSRYVAQAPVCALKVYMSSRCSKVTDALL